MKLSNEAVLALLTECQSVTEKRATVVGCIARSYTFDPAQLLRNRGRIAELLLQLPDEFHQSKGGGWSFLNACQDREGRQWTGLHSVMEALVALGIASRQARWLMPRSMWKALPGGMPFFQVDVRTP